MKKVWSCLVICGILCAPLPLRAEAAFFKKKVPSSTKPLKADVVLEVVPVKVRSILAGGTVDVLEKPPEEMGAVWSAVSFRINRVLIGEFEMAKDMTPGLWDQTKDAAKDKEVLKILTMDFQRPSDEPQQKKWFTMAVSDPYALFGVREGEESRRERYKVSLALLHKNPNSYVLVKSEKLT